MTIALEALLTYATCLAFYLHLRASEHYARRPELLHSHPVFLRLLTLKQSLTTLDNIDFALSDSEDNEEASSIGDGEPLGELWRTEKEVGLDPGELDELLKEASLPPQPLKRSVQFAEPPKKKRKTMKSVKQTDPAPEPIPPTLPPLRLPSTRTLTESDGVDSFGEATSLPYADAADKASRKKSLRFHTSKIESASMRRQGARNRAISGDDDLPYKERSKQKNERLAKEAIKRGRGQGGEDLNDIDADADGEQGPFDDDSEEEDGGDETTDGYYDLVKKKARAKKEQKAADYEASKAVDR